MNSKIAIIRKVSALALYSCQYIVAVRSSCLRRYVLLTEHLQRELFGRRMAETEEELSGVVKELSLKASREEKLRRICQRRVQARDILLCTSCWYVVQAQDLISVLGDNRRRIGSAVGPAAVQECM